MRRVVWHGEHCVAQLQVGRDARVQLVDGVKTELVERVTVEREWFDAI
jgi:hypothetical protein